jgi:hypothetical protein
MALSIKIHRMIFPWAAGATGNDSVRALPSLSTNDDADGRKMVLNWPAPWVHKRLEHKERCPIRQEPRRRNSVVYGFYKLCREIPPRPCRPGRRHLQPNSTPIRSWSGEQKGEQTVQSRTASPPW